MKRTHSTKHNVRPSLLPTSNDLGIIRECDQTNEDILRHQLLDKERENDKLSMQLQLFKAQLAERPPIERVQAIEKEYKNLELLLQGTQRENERCMAELERARQREKVLEQALAKLAGENWQSHLDIASSNITTRFGHTRANSISSPRTVISPVVQVLTPPSVHPPQAKSEGPVVDRQQELAHIEQIRLLILGMEQRLQTREEKLVKTLERAEGQGRRFDQLRKEISTGMD